MRALTASETKGAGVEQRRLVDGTVRVFLAEALIVPTGLLTAAFLTRRLGPEGYGLFMLVAVPIVWTEWTVAALFNRAFIKLISTAEDWRPAGTTIVRLLLASSAVATLALWCLAPSIATLLGEPTLTAHLRLYAFDIPLFCVAQAYRNILIGLGGFRERATASACRWVARLALIVLLVESGFGVSGAILGSMGASLVELCIAGLFVRPRVFSGRGLPLRSWWGYAAPLFLYALSLRLYDKSDLVLLKALGATPAEAGVYGAAQNLTLLPGLFAFSFTPLLVSSLGRALRAGEAGAAQALGRQAMRAVVLLWPLAAILVGASREVVTLVFGASFTSAAPLVGPLVCGAMAMAMLSVATSVMTAHGRPVWTFAVTGPLLLAAVGGQLSVIPHLGSYGAALVTMCVAGVGALVSLLVVHRLWRVSPPARTVARSIVACGLAYTVASLLPPHTAGLLLLAKLAAAAALALLALITLGEFSAQELSGLRSALRGRDRSAARALDATSEATSEAL